MSPGITPVTLDGINENWFNETSQLLKSGKFEFKPSRRINIPNTDGKIRPLSIGTTRDKIVQEAIRIILEAIFEINFSDNSHGFRPTRSCHTALKQLFNKFKYTQWLIEGDISKCFDSIDHKLLMDLIERKISDRRFTHYLNKALKAGYFDLKTFKHNIAGTPQGSIISPILANIFLDQLDHYIEELRVEFDKGNKPRRRFIARNFESKIRTAKAKGDMDSVRKLNIDARAYSLIDFEDPNFRRLTYLRYADDWVIGIRGTLDNTKEILRKVTDYCSSIGLKVSPEKTKIINLNTSKALFLGVEIIRSQVTKYTRVTSSTLKNRVGRQLRLTVPITRLIQQLRESGFILANKPAPRFLWLHNNHDQIIHLYNSVMRGILNYYSFAHNYSRLVSLLNHILKQSAAKLLSAKLNLRTRAKVFEKYGVSLTSPKGTSFIKPSYKSNYLEFRVSKFHLNLVENVQGLYVTRNYLDNLYNLICVSCGSYYRVDMSHIIKMSKLNPKISAIERLMAQGNRKQIPLCRECHMKKHSKTKST